VARVIGWLLEESGILLAVYFLAGCFDKKMTKNTARKHRYTDQKRPVFSCRCSDDLGAVFSENTAGLLVYPTTVPSPKMLSTPRLHLSY